jgi:hypothetical protein
MVAQCIYGIMGLATRRITGKILNLLQENSRRVRIRILHSLIAEDDEVEILRCGLAAPGLGPLPARRARPQALISGRSRARSADEALPTRPAVGSWRRARKLMQVAARLVGIQQEVPMPAEQKILKLAML